MARDYNYDRECGHLEAFLLSAAKVLADAADIAGSGLERGDIQQELRRMQRRLVELRIEGIATSWQMTGATR